MQRAMRVIALFFAEIRQTVIEISPVRIYFVLVDYLAMLVCR